MSYYYKSQPINPKAHSHNLQPKGHGGGSAEYSGDADPDEVLNCDFDPNPQPSQSQEKTSDTSGPGPARNPRGGNAMPQTEPSGGQPGLRQNSETRWIILEREEGQRGRSPTVRDRGRLPGLPDSQMLMKSCTNQISARNPTLNKGIF